MGATASEHLRSTFMCLMLHDPSSAHLRHVKSVVKTSRYSVRSSRAEIFSFERWQSYAWTCKPVWNQLAQDSVLFLAGSCYKLQVKCPQRVQHHALIELFGRETGIARTSQLTFTKPLWPMARCLQSTEHTLVGVVCNANNIVASISMIP